MSVKWRATLGAVLGHRPRTADMPGQFWCATSQAPSRRARRPPRRRRAEASDPIAREPRSVMPTCPARRRTPSAAASNGSRDAVRLPPAARTERLDKIFLHVNSRARQINMLCITFSLRYHHSGA